MARADRVLGRHRRRQFSPDGGEAVSDVSAERGRASDFQKSRVRQTHHGAGQMSDLAGPIFLSMRIAILATLLTAAIALPLAFWLGRRKPLGAGAMEVLILLPLVLPPTVIGYLLIRVLGAQGVVGMWLKRAFDYSF